MWPFSRKKPAGKEQVPPEQTFTMPDFFAQARREINGLVSLDPDWYRHLPYQGGMSPEDALMFEIEKRAIWRRVIFDAGRGDIAGLVWATRGDDLVCEKCRALEGRRFMKKDLADLMAMVMHVGCRCELMPIR